MGTITTYGIGNSGNVWFGGGEGLNHAYAEAMASQSLKAQWVVMAHEVGHLIGGRLGSGVVSAERAGDFLSSTLCAPSLMPAGSAGEPVSYLEYSLYFDITNA
jgi:large exoprotein involved in heme utilization and adhesion